MEARYFGRAVYRLRVVRRGMRSAIVGNVVRYRCADGVRAAVMDVHGKVLMECGLEGLSDRARRPFRSADQLPERVEAAIVSAKREKPH